jgi:hypothetical protein
MNAQDIVDAIITAGVRHGADGHGRDALDGRMFMLARTDRKGFGMLLARALRLKMKAKPDERDRTEGKKFLTYDEMMAFLRKAGHPEEAIKFFPYCDARNLPAESSGPNGTRDLMDAVINAAIRHGADGHGAHGLIGFMQLLQSAEPKIFSMLEGMAQRWQATSRPDEPNKHRPSEEELEAGLRAAGMDLDGFRKATSRGFELDFGENPYLSAEDQDYSTE